MEFGFWHVTSAVLVPGVLVASWIDYSQRRVPNWLNLTLIILGFIVQAVFFGWTGMREGGLGLLTGFSLLIVPWLMRAMGAGDVKLMAAIGVFMGPWLTFVSFALGAVIGGITAVIMTVSTGRLRMAYANLGLIMVKMSSPQTMFSDFASTKSLGSSSMLLPYGVPLSAGTLIILAATVFGWWGM